MCFIFALNSMQLRFYRKNHNNRYKTRWYYVWVWNECVRYFCIQKTEFKIKKNFAVTVNNNQKSKKCALFKYTYGNKSILISVFESLKNVNQYSYTDRMKHLAWFFLSSVKWKPRPNHAKYIYIYIHLYQNLIYFWQMNKNSKCVNGA